MQRIRGWTVFITGATAGIGEACARAMAARGAHLVLVARRIERLERLRAELRDEHGVDVRIAPLDVRDRPGVEGLVEALRADGVVPDVLVNNAGMARGLEKLHEADPAWWDEVIDTNVKGFLWATRAILPLMVERDRGHVVNLGSLAGHQVYDGANVYNATKFAVRALNEALALDLVGTKVRVSSIDPGLVETEFSEVRFHGDRERARKVYAGYTPLDPADVAEAVCWVVERPPHVNVLDMVILPTDQRSAHVVHREDA